MNKKILLPIVVIILIVLIGIFFWLKQESDNPIPKIYAPAVNQNSSSKIQNPDQHPSDPYLNLPQEETTENNPTVLPDDKPPIVGGDRDEHGCIGSAGYTWCEAKGKCLRSWEEKCE